MSALALVVLAVLFITSPIVRPFVVVGLLVLLLFAWSN